MFAIMFTGQYRSGTEVMLGRDPVYASQADAVAAVIGRVTVGEAWVYPVTDKHQSKVCNAEVVTVTGRGVRLSKLL